MPPPDPAPQPFVIEEYVRWSDVDFAGIIFYGSYVRLFEIAETEMFRHCGLAYARMFDEYDIFLPRKAVHSEFYWPARLDDRLRIAAHVHNPPFASSNDPSLYRWTIDTARGRESRGKRRAGAFALSRQSRVVVLSGRPTGRHNRAWCRGRGALPAPRRDARVHFRQRLSPGPSWKRQGQRRCRRIGHRERHPDN